MNGVLELKAQGLQNQQSQREEEEARPQAHHCNSSGSTVTAKAPSPSPLVRRMIGAVGSISSRSRGGDNVVFFFLSKAVDGRLPTGSFKIHLTFLHR